MGKKYTFAGYNNWITMTNHTIHEGRNIKRFREMLGMKQEALASELGEDWNQKKISLLESKETVEPGILQQVSKALKIPVEAIQSFDEEQAIINIQNNYDGSNNQGANLIYQSTINSIDKIMQLHEDKIALYERMLKEKEEMIATLKQLLEK